MLLVRSNDGEDGVADAAADFKNVILGIGGFTLVAEKLRKLGKQPVSVLEELVVVNRIELVPILVGIRVEISSLFIGNENAGILLYLLFCLLDELRIPFDVVPRRPNV